MWIAHRTFSSFRGPFPKVQWYSIIWFFIFNCRPLTGASLILEKLSTCYDVVCFSIFASGLRLDANITLENILRRCSIDNVVDHLYNASLVLADLSTRSRIRLIIKCLNFRSLWSSFRWSTMINFSECPALSVGSFKKVQCEVIISLM